MFGLTNDTLAILTTIVAQGAAFAFWMGSMSRHMTELEHRMDRLEKRIDEAVARLERTMGEILVAFNTRFSNHEGRLQAMERVK